MLPRVFYPLRRIIALYHTYKTPTESPNPPGNLKISKYRLFIHIHHKTNNVHLPRHVSHGSVTSSHFYLRSLAALVCWSLQKINWTAIAPHHYYNYHHHHNHYHYHHHHHHHISIVIIITSHDIGQLVSGLRILSFRAPETSAVSMIIESHWVEGQQRRRRRAFVSHVRVMISTGRRRWSYCEDACLCHWIYFNYA